MADNVSINQGSGPSVATDEVGGRHFQLVKPAFGVDGAATMVSASSPLPVESVRSVVGYVQGTVTSATAVTLADLLGTALPASARFADVYVDGEVCWRADGTAPTTTVGVLESVGFLSTGESLAQLKFIATGANVTLRAHLLS